MASTYPVRRWRDGQKRESLHGVDGMNDRAALVALLPSGIALATPLATALQDRSSTRYHNDNQVTGVTPLDPAAQDRLHLPLPPHHEIKLRPTGSRGDPAAVSNRLLRPQLIRSSRIDAAVGKIARSRGTNE